MFSKYILRDSYWAQEGSLEAVVSHARRVQELLMDDPVVAEFADLVSRAVRLESSAGDR